MTSWPCACPTKEGGLISLPGDQFLVMANTTAKHLFQVDLRGIIDILSDHLYSTQTVFVRELLQNSCDTIQMRRQEVVPTIIRAG